VYENSGSYGGEDFRYFTLKYVRRKIASTHSLLSNELQLILQQQTLPVKVYKEMYVNIFDP